MKKKEKKKMKKRKKKKKRGREKDATTRTYVENIPTDVYGQG